MYAWMRIYAGVCAYVRLHNRVGACVRVGVRACVDTYVRTCANGWLRMSVVCGVCVCAYDVIVQRFGVSVRMHACIYLATT